MKNKEKELEKYILDKLSKKEIIFKEQYEYAKKMETKFENFITESTLALDDNIKDELKILFLTKSDLPKEYVNDRIEQLFNIHKVWLNMVKNKLSAEEIANKLLQSEINLGSVHYKY